MEIRPVEADLFHAEGQTWLTVVFRNFVKAPKNIAQGG